MGTTNNLNGLRQLSCAYASDSSDEDPDRQVDDNSSETVSSISRDTSLDKESVGEIEDDLEDEESEGEKVPDIPKTRGELLLQDLPPIEDLKISVPSHTLCRLGVVSAIVEKQIVIQSSESMPPLNIDSILFLADGKPIGKIFDVFGQVKEPSYSVRFNTEHDITSKQLQVNAPVYFAVSKDASITSFVFVNQLTKLKGSDASWLDNNEPPDDAKEYSDDEEEQRAKSKKEARRRSENLENSNNSLSSRRSRPRNM